MTRARSLPAASLRQNTSVTRAVHVDLRAAQACCGLNGRHEEDRQFAVRRKKNAAAAKIRLGRRSSEALPLALLPNLRCWSTQVGRIFLFLYYCPVIADLFLWV